MVLYCQKAFLPAVAWILLLGGVCAGLAGPAAAAGPFSAGVVVEYHGTAGRPGKVAPPAVTAVVGPESGAGSFTTQTVDYSVRRKDSRGASITVDVCSVPGLPLESIRNALLNGETSTTHHNLVIFEGGKNNALTAGQNTDYLVENYQAIIGQVRGRLQENKEPLYIDEQTPVIADVLVARGFDGYQYQANLEALNEAEDELGRKGGLTVIDLYDLFLPHYTLDAASWCRNLANSDSQDGSHLSALGARQLGLAYWQAIAPYVQAHRSQWPLAVAIYGDSITACTYLPDAQKPAAWMLYYASSDAVQDWMGYP